MKITAFFPLALLALISLQSCNRNNSSSDAYGNFEATEITYSAEAQGKILSFLCDEGQNVKSGDTLGLIDTIDYYLKREGLLAQRNALTAKQMVIQSQSQVQTQQKENLLIEKKRLESLLKEKAATQKQMDDLEGNLKVIDKQILSTLMQTQGLNDEIQNLNRQIDLLAISLQRCRIISPVDGTILSRYAEAGELASLGKPLFKVADLSTLFLRVYISGAQLSGVKLGQNVEVLIDKDKKSTTPLSGEVSWISPSAEFTPKIIQTREERVNMVYAVKVKVSNDGRLKINMPGEVNFKK